MFFKNLTVFKTEFKRPASLKRLEQSLSAHSLSPCAPHETERIGFVPPRNSGTFVHSIDGLHLIALGVERKVLPASAVRQAAEARDTASLPAADPARRAFSHTDKTFAWLDTKNQLLGIDSATPSKVGDLAELIMLTTDIRLRTHRTVAAPSSAMASWLADGKAPGRFAIDRNPGPAGAGEARPGHAEHAPEAARRNPAEGKAVRNLALTWADRISFVLSDAMFIQQIGFLDPLKAQSAMPAENEEERFDRNFALMTGELAQMYQELVSALGGSSDVQGEQP